MKYLNILLTESILQENEGLKIGAMQRNGEIEKLLAEKQSQ